MSAAPALVLMYHHIATPCADPSALAVSAANLAEHLQVLKRVAKPRSLQALTDRLFNGSLEAQTVVVTFDDGYRDNLVDAWPLLERYKIPATIFVAAGASNRRPPYWWDELDRLLLTPGTLPSHFDLTLSGQTVRCDLGPSATYDEDAARRFRNWRVWEDAPTARHALYRSLHDLLQTLQPPEQAAVMDDVRRWSGACDNHVRAHERLTDAEIVCLASSRLIDIGGHTVTHPALATLPPKQQSEEIDRNKHHLESLAGRPLKSFAYPSGVYSEETTGIVRDAGYACACSAVIGPVHHDADPFQLPRRSVHDCDGETFQRWLAAAWRSS